ncbi:MAG: hypothetical protein QOD32_375 [Pyrinomonadaceae bacterium]|jgi:hypothetical protein|nr:hypothetical protein [Pyrinomonadaceae bacterium]
MGELVGVIHLIEVYDTASIKQEALLFDRIAVLDFQANVLRMREQVQPRMDDYFDTLEWLFDEGIIFEPEKIALDEKILANPDYQRFSKLTTEYAAQIRTLADWVEQGTVETEGDFISVDASPVFLGLQYYVRLKSLLLREKKGIDAYPVIHRHLQSINTPQATKTDVVQIVINALPLIDWSTPWEQIIEYRSDPESKGKFLALKNWINDIARAKLPAAEVEDKLEWLIHDYQQHLNLHKLKTKTGAFETVITSGAELVEDLVKIKWGKVAKMLFSLNHRKVALMEAELKSPGREIAYILGAREKFLG